MIVELLLGRQRRTEDSTFIEVLYDTDFIHWTCQRCRGGVEAFSHCKRCKYTGMEYGYFAAPGAILPYVRQFYWAARLERYRPTLGRKL